MLWVWVTAIESNQIDRINRFSNTFELAKINAICVDLILFDLIWFDLIWFDMICFNLVWFDLVWLLINALPWHQSKNVSFKWRTFSSVLFDSIHKLNWSWSQFSIYYGQYHIIIQEWILCRIEEEEVYLNNNIFIIIIIIIRILIILMIIIIIIIVTIIIIKILLFR